MANGQSGITGGPQPQSSELASKGRRFASAIIDLFIIPIIIGVVVGIVLMFLAIPEWIRYALLIVANIGWLIFRDYLFAPGRKMVGLKLVSLTGGRVMLLQAVCRNVFIAVPFVLIPGYLCEIARVFFPLLIWRRVWYSFTLLITLLVGVPGLVALIGDLSFINLIQCVLVIAAIAVPPLFLFSDKNELPEGVRLGDVFASTRVSLA